MTQNTNELNNDALTELNIQLQSLTNIVDKINDLQRDNLFRYLSKNARNALLVGLMEKSGAVEDAAKATYRSIKKGKRERLPESVADLLITNERLDAIACNPFVTGTPSPVFKDGTIIGTVKNSD